MTDSSRQHPGAAYPPALPADGDDRPSGGPTPQRLDTEFYRWWWVKHRPDGMSRETAGDQWDAWFEHTQQAAYRAGHRSGEYRTTHETEQEAARHSLTPDRPRTSTDDPGNGHHENCRVNKPHITDICNCGAPAPAVTSPRTEQGWRDRHGDVWTYNPADGLMHSYETAPFTREHVEKKWGPLVAVTVTERKGQRG